MKFYELFREYGQDPHVNVDTEYCMIKAWNAAIQACQDTLKSREYYSWAAEVDYYTVHPESILEALKQSEEVF